MSVLVNKADPFFGFDLNGMALITSIYRNPPLAGYVMLKRMSTASSLWFVHEDTHVAKLWKAERLRK